VGSTSIRVEPVLDESTRLSDSVDLSSRSLCSCLARDLLSHISLSLRLCRRDVYLGGMYMTTFVRPRNFALAPDRSVVPPRFAPGFSTTTGAFLPGTRTSPRTRPSLAGCLSSLGHVMSSGYSFWHGAQADRHTVELHHQRSIKRGMT